MLKRSGEKKQLTNDYRERGRERGEEETFESRSVVAPSLASVRTYLAEDSAARCNGGPIDVLIAPE